MIVDQTQYTLKKSNDIIGLSSSEEVLQASIALAQQARRSIDIFTQHLDQRIYNDKTLYDAILKLATYSRFSLVRILIQDTAPAVKNGCRLTELSYRISSRVKIRQPGVEFENHTEEFFIADECGLIRRLNPNRYEGELCFNAALKGRQLTKFFDDCWEKSTPPSDLRRLDI